MTLKIFYVVVTVHEGGFAGFNTSVCSPLFFLGFAFYLFKTGNRLYE